MKTLLRKSTKKKEIAEQKDNLAEQLSQVTKEVETVKGIVKHFVQSKDDLQIIVNALTAASKSTDNAVTAIVQAILDSRKVVFTNKLDDETITQLQTKYSDYSEKEEGMLKQHRKKIGDALDQNEKRCYEIINNADGVYFGRKNFIRLFIVFCVCFGIIFTEIVYGVVKWLGV